MNELYSTCIIHKRKDSFESLYLQYFLELMGIGVFNYSFDNTSEENNFILYGQDFNPVEIIDPNASSPLKERNRNRKAKATLKGMLPDTLKYIELHKKRELKK